MMFIYRIYTASTYQTSYKRYQVDILLLESLIPEAMAWLESRHSILYRPQLANDERALRHSTDQVRAMVVPRSIAVDHDFLAFAPKLEAVARIHGDVDNIDLELCHDRGVKVLVASSANARANAEFMLAALIMMRRPGIGETLQGLPQQSWPVGREINGSTIALLGLGHTAHMLAPMLANMGARIIGYDPAVHHSSPLWQQLRVQPAPLSELVGLADGVCVQMLYASRYQNFIGERVLAACKRGQVWVSISRSKMFNAEAMASAIKDGRVGAFLMDGAEEDFAGPNSPLNGLTHFYNMARLGANTRETRVRASWYLAHRLHEALIKKDSDLGDLPSGEVDRTVPDGLRSDQGPSSWIDSAPSSPQRSIASVGPASVGPASVPPASRPPKSGA